MISNENIPNVYKFSTEVLNWIFRNVDGTNVVIYDRNGAYK